MLEIDTNTKLDCDGYECVVKQRLQAELDGLKNVHPEVLTHHIVNETGIDFSKGFQIADVVIEWLRRNGGE